MMGRITLVGAGELMSAMSSVHRACLGRLQGAPRPVFLDTTAGFETNVDAIVAKAVEYYAHHLQTELRVARFRHREETSPAEVAAAVAEVKAANLFFAGPGSPTYAIKQWRGSPVWEAVVQRFQAGADLLFASAASIAVGRYALPVYEIYKAGEDPFWADGLDLLGHFGLNIAVVPHFDDASGGDSYDSRFCYMGARRFDVLQAQLPPQTTILGVDAYTAICFDPAKQAASVFGQGAITLIGDGAERRFEAGSEVPFAVLLSDRGGVVSHAPSDRAFAYEKEEADPADPRAALRQLVSSLGSLSEKEKVEILARLQALPEADSKAEAPLADLVLELRQALREAKRFDLADHARQALEELGFEVGDTPGGARWTRR